MENTTLSTSETSQTCTNNPINGTLNIWSISTRLEVHELQDSIEMIYAEL